jgi:exodeoxyribonuclease III
MSMRRWKRLRRGDVKILSWNVENLARYVEAGVLSGFVEAMGSPDVVCLQELRVRPADAELISSMTSALPGYACHYALANDPKNVTFRGGRLYGVATWVRSGLGVATGRTLSWDREGRLVIVELPAMRVAIVNVYAVNGTNKPYWDHEVGRIEGDRHMWKRRFIERLGQECVAMKSRGLELVLVGDWNVSRTAMDTYPRLRTEEPHATARAAFNDVFMPMLDVVDVFRELHPMERKYTFFNRRARAGRLDAARVDFALIARRLLPRVVEAEIDERVEARLGSDHAPIWVVVSEASVGA